MVTNFLKFKIIRELSENWNTNIYKQVETLVPISDPTTGGKKRMVSLIVPQKTATPIPQNKQSDVIEEPVDVEDKALTSKGNSVTKTDL